jgi:GTP-binding protein HflX
MPDHYGNSREKVFLFGISTPKDLIKINESLDELTLLSGTAGLTVSGRAYQKLPAPDPKTYMGKGKLREIFIEMQDCSTDTLVINDELTPGQQRNIEEILNGEIKIIDRTALILDIFAQHARTKEAQLQVELAQCQYRLPRLTGMWTHLIRQAGGRAGGIKGGVGLRGPGETQLESDRRGLRNRISVLKKQIIHIKNARKQHRRRRKKSGLHLITLAGYTNAGKSSLLNLLSNADIRAEDKLFATLNPSVRKVKLPSGKIVLFSDTVGFINKLPHELIAAFRATLEEIMESDIIVHLADITHPEADRHREVVNDLLHEIGTSEIPVIPVWNKIDKTRDDTVHRNGIHISAKTGKGTEKLLLKIEEILKSRLKSVRLLIPFSDGNIINILTERCFIEEKKDTDEGYIIEAFVPIELLKSFKNYIFSGTAS